MDEIKIFHCTCRVCGKKYIYELGGDKGYDRELCGPICDGIEMGERRSKTKIDALTAENDALTNQGHRKDVRIRELEGEIKGMKIGIAINKANGDRS